MSRRSSGAATGDAAGRIITQSNSSTRPVLRSRVTGYIPVISKPCASYSTRASVIRGLPS